MTLVVAILSATTRGNAFAGPCSKEGGYYWALGNRQRQAMPILWEMGWACHDEECRAAFDIVCTAVAMDGVVTPNSMAYLTPAYAEQAWNERKRIVRAFPYAHPGRVPLYCTYLTRLAALTPDEPRQEGDNSISFNIELAVRLWPLDHTCVAKVKAAFPDTPTIKANLADQDGECLDRPAWCLPRLVPPVHLRRHR